MKNLILILFLLTASYSYSQQINCVVTQLCKTVDDATECKNWNEKTTFILSKDKTKITSIGLVKTIYHVDKIDSENNSYFTHTAFGEIHKITISDNYIYVNSVTYKGLEVRYELAKKEGTNF